MKIPQTFFRAVALFAFSFGVYGGTVFQDGFESPLGALWSVSSTANGRAEIRADFEPATGTGHLVLDDSVSDATFSAAEATIALDMSNKKNAVLTFKAKSLGNEPHSPPTTTYSARTYDSASISTNGGQTWKSVQSLASLDGTWQTFVINLDSAVFSIGSYDSNFRIRFSEYDNASAPIDGIAIDDVVVTADDDQRLIVELPASVVEGTGPHTAYLLLSIPPAAATTVSFTVTPAASVTFPGSIEVAAGEMVVPISFSVPDDALVNLARVASITPVLAGATGFGSPITILDNEPVPIVSLSLPPQLAEGAAPTNNATLSLNVAAAVDLTFTLTSSPSSQVSIPTSLLVPAGQTQAIFTAQAVNDTALDGDIPVTVTATRSGLQSATATTTTIDNELPAIGFVFPATIVEGTSASATVTFSGPRSNDVAVTLTSSNGAALTVPASVVVPAGQTSAGFTLTAVNDSLVNLSRSVTVSGAGTGVSAGSRTITITDDEPAPVLTLTIPATLTEGDLPTNNATVSLTPAAAVAVAVTLSGSPVSEVTISATVTIPANQTSVTFTARATNDSKIDGDLPVTVTGTATGLASATAQTIAVDNETKTLAMTLAATITEGGSLSGTVTITGTWPTDLVVSLSGANASALTVPSSATILAGNTSASFTVAAPDNSTRDGTRNVSVSASSAGFTGSSRSIAVRDNDPASYQIGGLTDIVNVSAAVPVTVTAVDVENNVIAGYSGSVTVSLVLPDGSSASVTPGTVAISGATGWSGNLTLPSASTGPLKLRAVDSNGFAGESLVFDPMRVLAITAADLVWDGTRSRLYASVPATAGGAYGSKVVAVDPSSMLVTGTANSNQDPVKLVMTSGNEYLYAAQRGNGTVARIDPASMSILSAFAVGTSPSYGTLYAADLCTVAGQPNLVIVSQYRTNVSPSHNGVAVYDNGVIRPDKTQDHTGSNIIEPSADPTLYFGYNTESTEYGFRQLRLTSTGMTQIAVSQSGALFSGFYIDMKSAGNRVFSTSGIQVDGLQMRKLGSMTTAGAGPVHPDAAIGRVFYIEPSTSSSSTFDKLGSYDIATMSRIRRLSLPAGITTTPASLVRWGANGLAFRYGTSIAVISSKRMVPSEPPADLGVTVAANPNPVQVGGNLAYTMTVTNSGPNAASNTQINATFSDSQTIGIATSSVGTISASGLSVTLNVPTLAAGASATLTVNSTPLSAGTLSCTASATSDALDPVFDDNTASKVVSVGFSPLPDSVNAMRVAANNLVYDQTRGLLWVSIPSTVDAPLGRSIVSVNPATGIVSDPIPLGANPFADSMAISGNGRYLYVGLTDSPEVARVDLSPAIPVVTRIPLGSSGWGNANYAEDIEVLDGPGTSFLIAGSDDHSAAVFDNAVRRTNRTGIYTVDRVERTGTAGVFIGYNNYDSGFGLSRLVVNSSGVTIEQQVSSLVSGYGVDIKGGGNVVVSETGKLVNSSNLTLIATLTAGIPIVDTQNQRAFLLTNSTLNSYRTSDGVNMGAFQLTGTPTGSWAQSMVRWGLDGFAAIGSDGKLYIARWSGTIPPATDSDGDNISDAWEATYFGTLGASAGGDLDSDGIANAIEWFFATAPNQAGNTPVTTTVLGTGASRTLQVDFPRRAGISASAYRYETSCDPVVWVPATGYSQSVLQTQTINGVSVETVRVSIPFPDSACGFFRVAWLSP